jgi:hypothetical protein
VNVLRPGHQDVDEVVDHDRNLGAIDRLEPQQPIVRSPEGAGNVGHDRTLLVDDNATGQTLLLSMRSGALGHAIAKCHRGAENPCQLAAPTSVCAAVHARLPGSNADECPRSGRGSTVRLTPWPSQPDTFKSRSRGRLRQRRSTCGRRPAAGIGAWSRTTTSSRTTSGCSRPRPSAGTGCGRLDKPLSAMAPTGGSLRAVEAASGDRGRTRQPNCLRPAASRA